MTHSAIYERILEDLAAGEMNDLQKSIFAALRKAYPQGRTRRQLIGDCYGEACIPAETEDLNNNSHDRKIRIALGDMFNEKLIPIVSTSGEPGYRIDVSEERIYEMIAEWRSRAARTSEKIVAAQKLLVKVRQYGLEIVPQEIVTPEKKPEQLSFMQEQA